MTRPLYEFAEERAAVRLQSAWRMRCGTLAFAAKLAAVTVLSRAKEATARAAATAWTGYGTEGLSAEQWLVRVGVLPAVAAAVAQRAQQALHSAAQHQQQQQQQLKSQPLLSLPTAKTKKGQHQLFDALALQRWALGRQKATATATAISTANSSTTSGSKGSPKRPTTPSSSGADAADARLEAAGMSSSTDRRRVLQLMRSGSLKVQQVEAGESLLNYFTSPADARTLAAAVSGGCAAVEAVIAARFPSNKSRTQAMAAAISAAQYPVSALQIQCWLSRYEGKPGAAQSAIPAELSSAVTVPPAHIQALTWQPLLRSCRTICAVLGNLRLAGLRAVADAAMATAASIAGTSADTNPHALGKAAWALRTGVLLPVERWW
jgi:hypothetical protein